jgi:hypothetical protein
MLSRSLSLTFALLRGDNSPPAKVKAEEEQVLVVPSYGEHFHSLNLLLSVLLDFMDIVDALLDLLVVLNLEAEEALPLRELPSQVRAPNVDTDIPSSREISPSEQS